MTGASTRTCSMCGITIPAQVNIVPRGWELDKYTYALVCGGCMDRRRARGYQKPWMHEDPKRYHAALERIEREGR